MSEVRLIDAEALKKALAKNLTIWAFNTSYDGVLAEVIDNAPTVEINDKSLEIARKSIEKPYEEMPNEVTICEHYSVCERREYCRDKNCNDYIPKRPQGEWIEKLDYNRDTYYDCSVCGNSWTTIEGTPWDNGMNFCPNCGAQMVGGGDNE